MELVNAEERDQPVRKAGTINDGLTKFLPTNFMVAVLRQSEGATTTLLGGQSTSTTIFAIFFLWKHHVVRFGFKLDNTTLKTAGPTIWIAPTKSNAS